MIREKISARQLQRYYEETEGELSLSVDVSDQRFSLTHEFEACDTRWRLDMHGTEFDTIGFNLTNLSTESMRTKYEIVVKNQSNGDDHKWKDPDGLLIFSPLGTVDDTWGNDDVITFRILNTVTGLKVKNISIFLLRISIFNTVDEVNEKRRHDLRLPADGKMGAGRKKGSYREEFIQQDALVSTRLDKFGSGHLSMDAAHRDEDQGY